MDGVPELIRDLYEVIDRLEERFPGRHFTPDGHLVGSLGEAVAAHAFDLELMPASNAGYDAVTSDGRTVEVKATQGNAVGLQAKGELPDVLIAVRLLRDGSVEVAYNGPAAPVWDEAGAPQKNGQRRISLTKLRRLQEDRPSGSVPQVRPLP